jgi:HD-like signal output (HDOD) protein
MTTAPQFTDILRIQEDPVKAAFRARLVKVLESKGEILPSASSPRGRLWHLVNSPGSSLEECAEVIQLDAALSSRVLKVANSGAYGLATESVAGSILHLGLRFVREQVFNASVFQQHAAWTLPPEWNKYWLRSIFTARLAERISASYGSVTGTEYLAGLIHDMGWLFLATTFPEEFTQLCDTGLPLEEAERDIQPYTHAEIAAAIAARSLLPARIIDAIARHHRPLENNDGTPVLPDRKANVTAVVLNLCDGVADVCGMEMFGTARQTLEQLQEGDQLRWLSHFGKTVDLRAIAEAELAKSQEVFDAYFSK